MSYEDHFPVFKSSLPMARAAHWSFVFSTVNSTKDVGERRKGTITVSPRLVRHEVLRRFVQLRRNGCQWRPRTRTQRRCASLREDKGFYVNPPPYSSMSSRRFPATSRWQVVRIRVHFEPDRKTSVPNAWDYDMPITWPSNSWRQGLLTRQRPLARPRSRKSPCISIPPPIVLRRDQETFETASVIPKSGVPLDFYSKSPGWKSSRYRTGRLASGVPLDLLPQGQALFPMPDCLCGAVAPRDVRYPGFCQYAQAALNSELRTLRRWCQERRVAIGPRPRFSTRPLVTGSASLRDRPGPVGLAPCVAGATSSTRMPTPPTPQRHRYLSGDGGRTAK